TADSRQVRPGYLFAALPGHARDGRAYIGDAVARGAGVILAAPGTRVEAGSVRLIEDSNPRRCFAELAATFHGRQPRVVAAVTGTNGKTSVATFIRQIWTKLGTAAGSIGTLGVTVPGMTIPGSLTTPDAEVLSRLLADLARRGVEHVALEASSHGLDQYRLDGVRLAAAAFTNLTRDHLDYHESVEAYRAAKERLFAEVLPMGAPAVLNADDPAFPMFRDAARGGTVWTYGIGGEDVRLAAMTPAPAGQELELEVRGQRFTGFLPLPGAFQVLNALCALGLVVALGAEAGAAVAALATLEGVPGRLQRVAVRRNGAPVYVDYAHTPDALETVLLALRPQGSGRLWVVFGCGGDRDRGKRPQMGVLAARLADTVIVTDDNPRSENPARIRAEILAGCPAAREIGDRAVAIQTAIADLAPGDVLLVAGKGHESGQVIGATVVPFDDGAVCRQAVSRTDGREAQ
ncbi:MAG: UDP-N-acetylmuramoyl-L-alanyl-D-glutamate--2 6-diaminopimelate ligase, partial [Rhodospirillaceae bacterium]